MGRKVHPIYARRYEVSEAVMRRLVDILKEEVFDGELPDTTLTGLEIKVNHKMSGISAAGYFGGALVGSVTKKED